MSFDKPASGDSFPDRNSEGGDRPFPGAPENREPVEEPTNSRSLDDIRAAREKAGSLEELDAIEKATRPTADWPEPRSPDPGSPTERPATASGGEADALEGRRPDGTSRAEGFLRPDSELPSFPGAPEHREPVEEPTNSRGLDDIRAAHERAGSLEELDAIEKATRPAGYETPAPGPDGREPFGPDAFAGWTEGVRRVDEGESGEPDGADRAGPGSRSSADSSQHAQRVEEAGCEEEAEGQDGESQEREPEEQSRVHDRIPDANPAQPDEAGPEGSPDARLDDQRPLTVADSKALIADALAENNAKHEAELDEQLAKHQAETDDLKAGYESRISALEAKVEGGREDQARDRPLNDTQAEQGATSDTRSAETGRRGDRLSRGVAESEDASEDPDGSQDQAAALGGYEGTEQRAEGKKAELTRWRRFITSDNINATGTVAGAVNTAAMFAVHATPDGVVSLGITILGLTGLAVSRIEKYRKDKHERPN